MDPLKPIESLSEMWALGYKIWRIAPSFFSQDQRALFSVASPDGREIGRAKTTDQVLSVVNRHRQTTPGAA